MDNITIDNYIDRFLEELETINNYVEYMEQNFYIQYKKLDFANELLLNFDFYTDDTEQRKSNQQIIKNIQLLIEEKIKEYELKLNTCQKLDMPVELSNKPMFQDQYIDFIEYMAPIYQDDYNEYITNITPEELKTDIESSIESMSKGNYTSYSIKDYTDLIEYCRIDYHNSYIDELQYDYEKLLNFQTLYRIFDSENPINIYRQSFILIITAFDATMYDIAKILFTNDFFTFISKIAKKDKKDKVTFSEIAESGDFNTLSKKIIDDHLGSIYLHKLLFLLRDFRSDLFAIDGQDYFITIIEMVKRRNIHVHNKGIVDQQYFESGINHNIYNLKLDDYSSIDDSYYIDCYDVLNKLMLYLRLLE